MIHFSCPECGKSFKLADDAAGRKAKCPCGESLIVPAAQAPVVAQAESAPPSAMPPAVSPPPAAPITLPADASVTAGADVRPWSASPAPLTCLGSYVAAGMLMVAGIVVGLVTGAPVILYACAVVLAGLIAVGAELSRRATVYSLTADTICLKMGILSRATKELPVAGILQITVSQSFIERLVGLGSISFATAATGGVEMVWHGVSGPESIRDMVRQRQGVTR